MSQNEMLPKHIVPFCCMNFSSYLYICGDMCRPVNTAAGRLLFEHYIHPCLATNTSSVSVSRILLPLGFQGYEFSVSGVRSVFDEVSCTAKYESRLYFSTLRMSCTAEW